MMWVVAISRGFVDFYWPDQALAVADRKPGRNHRRVIHGVADLSVQPAVEAPIDRHAGLASPPTCVGSSALKTSFAT